MVMDACGSDCVHAVYMDDRALISDDPGKALIAKNVWADFSKRFHFWKPIRKCNLLQLFQTARV